MAAVVLARTRKTRSAVAVASVDIHRDFADPRALEEVARAPTRLPPGLTPVEYEMQTSDEKAGSSSVLSPIYQVHTFEFS